MLPVTRRVLIINVAFSTSPVEASRNQFVPHHETNSINRVVTIHHHQHVFFVMTSMPHDPFFRGPFAERSRSATSPPLTFDALLRCSAVAPGPFRSRAPCFSIWGGSFIDYLGRTIYDTSLLARENPSLTLFDRIYKCLHHETPNLERKLMPSLAANATYPSQSPRYVTRPVPARSNLSVGLSSATLMIARFG